MMKFIRKYDWAKISGILSLLAVDGFIVLGLVAFCTNVSSKMDIDEETKATADSRKLSFVLPAIPETITDVAGRASYLALHWWDKFDFTDTLCLHLPEVTEQAFVDFIDILPSVDENIAARALNTLLTLARLEDSDRVYHYFLTMSENYLYDPNSPLRNEELYSLVLDYVLRNTNDGDPERIRPLYQLEEVKKNRPGSIASDFLYMLHDGRKGWLHDLQSEYTLLYFYDPDCPDCRHTKRMLEELPSVVGLVESGRMQILAFYPDGDADAWESCRDILPVGWLNTCDGTEELVVKDKLYAIRAIPSLYLLDSEKRVILKDADYNKLDAWLNEYLPAS